jgi:hypothetical protein
VVVLIGIIMVDIVVPFRNRAPQLKVLVPALLCRNVRRILIAEQSANAPFNRGAIKNAGFKALAPANDDTVYFHDVDLLPGDAMLQYPIAQPHSCVHLYGHRHCLGGVIGMQALDFATVGGFDTERWHWGGEDRDLQQRWLAYGMTIDRTAFKQRFATTSAFFAELDDTGYPMLPNHARDAFLASCGPRGTRRVLPDSSKTTIVCPLVHAMSYVTLGHGHYHGMSDGRVSHLLIDIGHPLRC